MFCFWPCDLAFLLQDKVPKFKEFCKMKTISIHSQFVSSQLYHRHLDFGRHFLFYHLPCSYVGALFFQPLGLGLTGRGLHLNPMRTVMGYQLRFENLCMLSLVSWILSCVDNWDLGVCLYFSLKHGNLDHSAPKAGAGSNFKEKT